MDFWRKCPLSPSNPLKGQTDFVNYLRKYLLYRKNYETKIETRKKLYKKGHIYVLSNYNILIVIIKRTVNSVAPADGGVPS